MMSVALAKELRAAGLVWRPRQFDFFHIPDRDLDERLFVVADLSVDIQQLADGIAAITFNGAVEWSLDYILQQDVVWVPTESQLRDRLGSRLRELSFSDDRWTCTVEVDGRTERHQATSAEDAYGSALLSLIRTSA